MADVEQAHSRRRNLHLPESFRHAKTSRTLSSVDNTIHSLKGRHVDYIKSFTAAVSLLHVLSHCRGILGDDQTSKLSWFSQEKGLFRIINWED